MSFTRSMMFRILAPVDMNFLVRWRKDIFCKFQSRWKVELSRHSWIFGGILRLPITTRQPCHLWSFSNVDALQFCHLKASLRCKSSNLPGVPVSTERSKKSSYPGVPWVPGGLNNFYHFFPVCFWPATNHHNQFNWISAKMIPLTTKVIPAIIAEQDPEESGPHKINVILFYIIPFHFILYHLFSIHFIWYHFVSFYFISYHYISSHIESSHIISFYIVSALGIRWECLSWSFDYPDINIKKRIR